ncbi:MAG TPA: 3D domain-containing protein [bacterium]|nr:3D domain-containing protein [bacterium]
MTAYYSPKPDQTLYLRGSYEADIRLNGNGTNGASGKEVFAGMIAAPKTYAFGTRIELSGIGIGIVEDRGGAIVVAGERGYDADRIDIWMGEGEEGLIRALTFGKRTVYGRVLSESSAVSTIDLTSFPSDRKAVIASLSRQSSKIPDA